MSFRAPRRVCCDGNEGMISPGLQPPLPAVRINDNPLLWSSVSDPSRDRVDSFPPTLRRRRNMRELDQRSGIGLWGLATVKRNGKSQQQRSLPKNGDQRSRLHLSKRYQSRVDFDLLAPFAFADVQCSM